MTSFGWKRKLPQAKDKNVSHIFEDSDDGNNTNEDVDDGKSTLCKIKRIKRSTDSTVCVEAKQLKDEGVALAECQLYVQALDKWNKALQFTPHDASLYEMISQVHQQLGNDFASLSAAQKAVDTDPLWWVGFQTIGRAQLNIGEPKLALLNFSRALHLNPSAEDVRNEDLPWAFSLCRKNLANISLSTAEEQLPVLARISSNYVKSRLSS